MPCQGLVSGSDQVEIVVRCNVGCIVKGAPHPLSSQAAAAVVPGHARAVEVPVVGAIDSVWERLLIAGPLQFAVHEIVFIILQCFNFGRVGPQDVLFADKHRFGVGRIVGASHDVIRESLSVVRGEQSRLLHVPYGEQSVIPLVFIPVLLVAGYEGGPEPYQVRHRFGDEEIHIGLVSVSVFDGDHVFAFALEAERIHLFAGTAFFKFAEGCAFREFACDTLDRLPAVDCAQHL